MKRLRRAWWAVGAPVRALLIGGIRLYRLTLAGWLGGQCRFHPTCSHYAEAAIAERGALRGSALAAWRIARCNPFGRGGIDPVRTSATRTDGYDPIIRDREQRAG